MAVVLNSGLNTVERVYDKTKNNIKYGTAAAVAGGTYLAVKSPTFRGYASKGISNTVGWTGGKIVSLFKWIGEKISGKFGNTKFGKTVSDYASKINNSETTKAAKEGFRSAGQKIVEQYGKIKTSSFGETIKNILTTGKEKINNCGQWLGDKLKPFVDKIPKKGILGAIAIAAGLALIAISHKHGYNAGKIDQRYEDKQKVINQFQI